MPFDPTTSARTRSTFLPRRSSVVLDGAEGTIITVDKGCLWVTLERDSRDIVLTKGMRFEIDRSGRTVIVAEDDSRVRFTRASTAFERTAAWFGRASAATIRDWARRLSRRATPYF